MPTRIGVYHDGRLTFPCQSVYTGDPTMYLCDECAEEYLTDWVFLIEYSRAGEPLRCEDCDSPNRDYDEE
jgi:DNA-directed RNA polymerase subunit RPC12/RpoP